MTLIPLSDFEAELAKEGIVKLCDFPFASWLLSTPPTSRSPSPSKRADQDISDVLGERRKTVYGKARWKNRGRANAVGSGNHLRGTTLKPVATETPATIPQTGFECASPVIQTYTRFPVKNSSPSTRIPHCERCGRIGLRRNGRWDYCPPCGLYQPIE